MTYCTTPGHPRHPPCPICNDCISSRAVCAHCQAEPWNDIWIVRHRRELLSGESGEIADATGARHAEVVDEPIRDTTDLQRAIHDLILRGAVMPYRYVDRHGHSRGVRYRIRALTVREIAVRLKCDFRYVAKLRRRVHDED